MIHDKQNHNINSNNDNDHNDAINKITTFLKARAGEKVFHDLPNLDQVHLIVIHPAIPLTPTRCGRCTA